MKVIEPWTKTGAVIGSQDDCVNEVNEAYKEINNVDWTEVNDEDRYDSAAIANAAINKMMGK
jgi:flavin-binding protein dodecin